MAVMTREQKLERKGIIHFDVDAVFARLTAKQSATTDLAAAARPIVGASAVLAGHIRERMLRGLGADGQLHLKRSGKPIGFVTGGMWSGVEAKGDGSTRAASVFFGGQSKADPSFGDLGRGARFKQAAREGRVRTSSWGTIRNDLKARNVWARHAGFNVIEPALQEIMSVAEAIGKDLQQAITIDLGGMVGRPDLVFVGADPGLSAKLAAFWAR